MFLHGWMEIPWILGPRFAVGRGGMPWSRGELRITRGKRIPEVSVEFQRQNLVQESPKRSPIPGFSIHRKTWRVLGGKFPNSHGIRRGFTQRLSADLEIWEEGKSPGIKPGFQPRPAKA